MVPFLQKRPSEYMRERMWFATQPIDEPDDLQHLIETIRHIGEEKVIFASDGRTTISITRTEKYRVQQYSVSVVEDEVRISL